MNEPIGSFQGKLPQGTEAITAAIQRATREAVLEHARAGRPVATWRDGQVVWVQPEEILARYGNGSLVPPE